MASLSLSQSSPYAATLFFNAASTETAALVRSGAPGPTTLPLSSLAAGPLKAFLASVPDWRTLTLTHKLRITWLNSPAPITNIVSVSPTPNPTEMIGPTTSYPDADTLRFANGSGGSGSTTIGLEIRFVPSNMR